MRGRPWTLAALLLFAVLAAVPGYLVGGDNGSQDASRQAREDDIREAVFRYLFTHNSSGGQSNVGAYYLSLADDAQDPSGEFMIRFRDEQPPVKKVSSCTYSAADGVRDIATGERGLIFRVTSLRWVSASEAKAEGGYYEGGLSGSGSIFRVGQRNGRWTVLEETPRWIS